MRSSDRATAPPPQHTFTESSERSRIGAATRERGFERSGDVPQCGTTPYVRPRAIGDPRSWDILSNHFDGFAVSGSGGEPRLALLGRTVL